MFLWDFLEGVNNYSILQVLVCKIQKTMYFHPNTIVLEMIQFPPSFFGLQKSDKDQAFK